MDKRTTDIVAYLSWPGLLVAFLLGDRAGGRFHLNQSLVIWLAITALGVVTRWMPLIGGIVRVAGIVFLAMCWFIGFINAVQGVEREVPLVGSIRLL